MNLTRIDLNLLLVLAVVLEEGSATRAARRLHVTQSAVSNSLARLRDLLDDPLVVRGRRGLVPTPRAREIAPMLASAMEQLSAVVEGGPLPPEDTTRCFTLACSDGQQLSDVPRIATALAESMPRASLRVVSIEYLLTRDGLASGEVDVAMGPPPDEQRLLYQPLYTDTAVLVVRRDHPRARGRLTKALFNELEHVDTHLAMGPGRGHELAERALREHGLQRRVVMTVPSFAAAVRVAAQTDYAAGVPRRVAQALAANAGVRVLELPIRTFELELGLLWHPRTDADATSRFFREVIVISTSQVASP